MEAFLLNKIVAINLFSIFWFGVVIYGIPAQVVIAVFFSKKDAPELGNPN